jgi:hypothetical protein
LVQPKIKRIKLPQSDTGEAGSKGSGSRASAPAKVMHVGDSTDPKAIEQQIQQLFDQVKKLQETLAGKRGNVTSSMHSAVRAITSKTDQTDLAHTAETTSRPQDSTKLSAIETPTPPASRHVVRNMPKIEQVRRLARHGYRATTTELVNIAHELEKDLPRVGAPIVSLIRKRLAVIARDVLETNDYFIGRAVKAYQGASIIGLVREEFAFSELANIHYRRMATALVKVAGTLEGIRSPAVTHITSMLHDRLRVMAAEAESENDGRMRRALRGAQDYFIRRDFDRSIALTPTKPVRLPGATGLDKHAVTSTKRSSSSQVRIADTTYTILRGVASSNQQGQELSRGPTSSADFKSNTCRSTDSSKSAVKPTERMSGKCNSGKRLVQHIQARSRSMNSSDHLDITASATNQGESSLRPSENSLHARSVSKPQGVCPPQETKPSQPTARESEEMSEQSLLEELFPEASTAPPARDSEKQEKYQKLELPESNRLIRRETIDTPRTLKEQVFQSLHKRGEQVTVLQLEHCSTELTESDFRRLVPKGKHLEGWNRDGEFFKIIPGRDPLSLERLPFYYLLFKTPESALAYQNNATRIHKLAALHQPSSILSAIPPPKGFLEDGEDISAIRASYVLKPTEHAMTLRTLMQPYHPALRALLDQGGYKPIVPNVDDKGNRIHKVLMHIEGYEPSRSDLFKIFTRDAYNRGLALSLRNEVSSSIHRLRDIVNLKTHMQPISTTNPRAFGHWESTDSTSMKLEFDDPAIAALMRSDTEADGDATKSINQIVMNRMYNRWLIEFDDEDEARRFAFAWHRRPLPELVKGDRTWKDYEEVRMCNCEVLW